MASCWSDTARCSVLEVLWKIWVVLVFFTCLCYVVQVHINEHSLKNQNLRERSKNLTKRVQELEYTVKLLRDKMDSLESPFVQQTKVQTGERSRASQQKNPQVNGGSKNRSDCTRCKPRCKKFGLCIQKEVKRALNDTVTRIVQKALKESFQGICQKCRGDPVYAQFVCENDPVKRGPREAFLDCTKTNDPKAIENCGVFRTGKTIRNRRAGYYFVYIHVVFASPPTQNTISISYNVTANEKLVNLVSEETSSSTTSVDLYGTVHLPPEAGLYITVEGAATSKIKIKGKDSFFGLRLEEEIDSSSPPAEC